jgi:hypothetical protein
MQRVFEDKGRKIKVEQSNGELRFNVLFPADIYACLHYMKAHPDSARNRITCARITEEIEDNGSIKTVIPVTINEKPYEVYTPNLLAGNNFIILNSALKHNFSDILREYAVFLDMKKSVAGIEKRTAVIKRTDPYSFNWQDAVERCYKSDRAYATASIRKAPQGYAAVYMFIEPDSEAAHDLYIDYLKTLPEPNLEKLIVMPN